MAKKIYFILFSLVSSLGLCLFQPAGFGQEEKITKLMPAQTEFVSQKEDKSQLVVIDIYKFKSFSTKEKILEFYRKLFANESFSELKGYSPERKGGGPQMAYFFTKANELILLNILLEPEDGAFTYYVTFHKPDVNGIKNFNQQEQKYEKE